MKSSDKRWEKMWKPTKIIIGMGWTRLIEILWIFFVTMFGSLIFFSFLIFSAYCESKCLNANMPMIISLLLNLCSRSALYYNIILLNSSLFCESHIVGVSVLFARDGMRCERCEEGGKSCSLVVDFICSVFFSFFLFLFAFFFVQCYLLPSAALSIIFFFGTFSYSHWASFYHVPFILASGYPLDDGD